jgi:hypothetical protein
MMFKLTEILMQISFLLHKYSIHVFIAGCLLLGLWALISFTGFSEHSGITGLIAGFLTALFILRQRKSGKK